MSKKVFCGECLYYQGEGFCYEELCSTKENLEDTYLERDGAYKKEPHEINENNDCEWFASPAPRPVSQKKSFWKKLFYNE